MKIPRWFPATAIVLVLALQNSTLAQAQLPAPPAKTIEERLAELEKEMSLLKRQQEVQKEVDLKKETETPVVVAGKDGFGLKSKDGNFQLKFRGQIQTDARFFANDDRNPGVNQFLPRRIRTSLEGTVFKYFDFRLMPDFGNGTVTLQDAWVDFKYWPQASLRAGKFKSPIGLERLQSDPNTIFAETALSTNLVPNRDVGIDLHGDFWDGTITYDAAVMNGVVDNGNLDTDLADDKDFVGRIFSHPFRNTDIDALNGLGVGLGMSYGDVHGTVASPQLPTFRSFGQQTVYSYRSDGTAAGTTIANGGRTRFAPQAYYYWGPVGLLTEFVWSSQDVKRNTERSSLKNWGWQLAGSYVITGENASYNGVVPRYNFDPREGRWGALEIVGRFSELTGDSDAYALFVNPQTSVRKARAWTAGLNWYWNKNIKWMLDYEQTFFQDGYALSGAAAREREIENALIGRLQIAF
ncbi:MAG TPA: porin [Verrucomicrobiae bacterium]|jgi:phosphate-selective porin OprO/OprP|nr:porin [Verrucomicrobiae bacterium]